MGGREMEAWGPRPPSLGRPLDTRSVPLIQTGSQPPSVGGTQVAPARSTARISGSSAGGSANRPSALPVFLSKPNSEKGRRRIRTNGRMGFQRDPDPHAGRRTVAMPVARSVNRMKVSGASSLGVAPTDANRLRALARRAAAEFARGEGERQTFCSQTRAAMEKAIHYLEGKEPRLAVCERSCGACALLSRATTNALEYAGQVAGRASPEELPPAASSSVTAPLSGPRGPEPPASPGGLGGSAGGAAVRPRTAADFFASIS